MAAFFNTAASVVHTTSDQLQITANHVFPPHQREETLKRVRHFGNRNPKLTAFLTTQAALAGLPLLFFFAFAAITLLVSLATCLLLSLFASVVFTSFVVGFALLFVVPTVIIASCSATFIFVWAFVGYLILRRLNEGEVPVKPGTRVGDKLQGLTGGRLGLWTGDGATKDGHKKTVEADTSQAAKDQGGMDRHKVRANAPHQDTSDSLDLPQGSNRSNGYVEWESKWADGVQQHPVILETGNTYEILKKETTLA